MPNAEHNPYSSPQSEPHGSGRRGDGWVCVAVAAAAMVATFPGRTHGLGTITEPLLSTLHLDRTWYAEMNLWATLVGALFCLPCGTLLDRFGSRRVLFAVVVALGAVVAAMSRVETWPALLLAVTLTRGLGQSMLSVASLTIIGRAFRNRLGLAMGVYSVLVGLGFGAAGKLAVMAVVEFEWRSAWLALGLVLLAGMAPLAWLLPRDGQRQDELTMPGDEHDSAQAGSTLGQALWSPTFWIFAVASSTYGLIASGLSLFHQSILAERGFDVEMFGNVLMISPLAGMVSNVLGGWASSRWALNRLLALATMLLTASLMSLPYLTATWQVYGYAISMGLAGGLVTVSFFTVWRLAFGAAHLGKIQGAAQMLTVLASAVGPRLLAECQERTGSYMPMFYACAAGVAALGAAAWLTPLPTPSAADSRSRVPGSGFRTATALPTPAEADITGSLRREILNPEP